MNDLGLPQTFVDWSGQSTTAFASGRRQTFQLSAGTGSPQGALVAFAAPTASCGGTITGSPACAAAGREAGEGRAEREAQEHPCSTGHS